MTIVPWHARWPRGSHPGSSERDLAAGASLVTGQLVALDGSNDVIAATGTSCRHQIFDGTGRRARHPVEILRDSLSAD